MCFLLKSHRKANSLQVHFCQSACARMKIEVKYEAHGPSVSYEKIWNACKFEAFGSIMKRNQCSPTGTSPFPPIVGILVLSVLQGPSGGYWHPQVPCYGEAVPATGYHRGSSGADVAELCHTSSFCWIFSIKKRRNE